jgi:REJ domain
MRKATNSFPLRAIFFLCALQAFSSAGYAQTPLELRLLISPTTSKIKTTEHVTAIVTVPDGSGPYSYRWCYANGSDTTWNPVTTSPIWAINPTSLPFFTAGSTLTVMVEVTLTATKQTGYVSRKLLINLPPSGGTLTATPLIGTAFQTSFTLNAADWTDDDSGALRYQFGYYTGTGSKVMLSSFPSAGPVWTGYLPQGPLSGSQLDIFVVVTDVSSEATEARCRVTVVMPGQLFVAFVEDTSSARTTINSDDSIRVQTVVVAPYGPPSAYRWCTVKGIDTTWNPDTTRAWWTINPSCLSAFTPGDTIKVIVTVTSPPLFSGSPFGVPESPLKTSCSTWRYVNGPPHGGRLSVTPDFGAALMTPFSMTALDWLDDEGAEYIRFRFGYMDGAGVKTYLNALSNASALTCLLPPSTFDDHHLDLFVEALDLRNLSAQTIQPVAVFALQLPVELQNFSLEALKESVLLSWSTATETDNYGFDIQRKRTEQGTWEKIGFVRGQGTSNAPHSYAFTSKNESNGKNAYRLKQIDNSGVFSYSDERTIDARPKLSESVQLIRAHPFPDTSSIACDAHCLRRARSCHRHACRRGEAGGKLHGDIRRVAACKRHLSLPTDGGGPYQDDEDGAGQINSAPGGRRVLQYGPGNGICWRPSHTRSDRPPPTSEVSVHIAKSSNGTHS